jgi:hypothetical protein
LGVEVARCSLLRAQINDANLSFPHLDQISPTAFSETINDINVMIIEANDSGWACLDNTLAVLSVYSSPFLLGSRYQRVSVVCGLLLTYRLKLSHYQAMKKLEKRIDEANKTTFNPVGLNLRKPEDTAFLFLEVRRCRCVQDTVLTPCLCIFIRWSTSSPSFFPSLHHVYQLPEHLYYTSMSILLQ